MSQPFSGKDAMAVETKHISDANQTRSDALRAVKLVIEAASLGVDEKAKDAAILLKEVLHNYRTVTTVPMNEVTPLVHNMIEDMRKPRYSSAVKDIGLDEAVKRLEDDNETFNDIYVERTYSQEVFDIQGNMKEIRPRADKALLNLANGINAIYLANEMAGKADEDNPYNIIVSVDGLVDQVKLDYEHRHPGSYKDKNKPGDDEHVTPVTPELHISSQSVEDAKHMLLVAADQAAFARALYPAAEGGLMKLKASGYHDYDEFPKAGFDVQNGKVIGITVAPPQSNMAFKQPMNLITQASAKILKDGNTLAILTGVEWPESFWGLRKDTRDSENQDAIGYIGFVYRFLCTFTSNSRYTNEN
jgi:hypothetical protein